MAPSTTAWARWRGGSRSPSTSMATVRAPRSRARRSPAAAARRSDLARSCPARLPSPTTTTRGAGSRPLVCTWVTCPTLPGNFSAVEHVAERRRRAARSTRASRLAQLLVVRVDADDERVGRDLVEPAARRRTVDLHAPVLARRAPRARRIMSISPSVVSSRSTASTSTHCASAASLPAHSVPDSAIRQVVDQHVMIANAPLGIAHDAIEDAGTRSPTRIVMPHSSATSRATASRRGLAELDAARPAGSTSRRAAAGRGARAAPGRRRARRRRRRRAGTSGYSRPSLTRGPASQASVA